jgi:hypothetical protein
VFCVSFGVGMGRGRLRAFAWYVKLAYIRDTLLYGVDALIERMCMHVCLLGCLAFLVGEEVNPTGYQDSTARKSDCAADAIQAIICVSVSADDMRSKKRRPRLMLSLGHRL